MGAARHVMDMGYGMKPPGVIGTKINPLAPDTLCPGIEAATISLLMDELTQPDMLELYVETYNAARREYARGESSRRAELEHKVAKLDAEVGRLIDFVARGIGNTDRLAPDYETRCRELDEARADPALAPPPMDSVALHPAALAGYRRAISSLVPLMGGDLSGIDRKMTDQLRNLINTVTVYPGQAPGQVEIELTGHLRALIDAPPIGRVWEAVVARGATKLVTHDLSGRSKLSLYY
ncbi:hypothetical protein [Fuscibacter oryzae]|uniref:Uncharacterized protein n=1 Tax=Fuscibacter oryzae TaxID=2803939 RepID=A0A8J7MW25_9RHOB|nr:hypothetical protein [Fuscibacter oryzae]MBL4928919.1 hypothetical protein [Fuscibacter oryzae]